MLALLSGYFGDPTDPRLIPASVSLELVHVATLYHDDVIDEAESRHGVPAANVRWDNTVAILTGDYLFARASEVGADLGPDVCRILAQTIAVLCDGQIREVDASRRLDQTEANYLEVIRRKTGALIATSCRLGAMMSDAPRRARRHPRGVRRVARSRLPALGRHHGHHVQPARARQGAGRRHEGGRLHPARAPRPPDVTRSGGAGADPDARAWTASSSTARSRSSRTATRSSTRVRPSATRSRARSPSSSDSRRGPRSTRWCSSRGSFRRAAGPTRGRRCGHGRGLRERGGSC